MDVVGYIFEVLHVGPDDHVAQSQEVTMADIVYFHDAPRILSASHCYNYKQHHQVKESVEV